MSRFSRPIQVYIALVILCGLMVLFAQLPREMDSSQWILLATLVVSGTLAGMYTLPMVYGRLKIDLSGAVLLMAVFLGDPSIAVLVAAMVSIVAGIGLRRRRAWNILFNAATEILGVSLASVLYHGYADPRMLPLDSWGNAMGLLLGAGTYWVVNSALVTVLAAARTGEGFMRTYVRNWSEFYLQCILLTLLATLGAAGWRQGPLYALLLFVPTVAVYQLLSVSRIKQEQVIHAIEIIAEVLDRRNPFTFQHSQRVAENTVKIARAAGLTVSDIEVLHRAALIHDIGKLGVEEPSQEYAITRSDLTAYQFYSLKQHAQLGALMAREIPAFEEAEEPIRYHHDWFDGTHVSKAHSGEEIPVGARIIAIADSYDVLSMANGEASLTCDTKAMEALCAMGNRQLDPELLGTFLEILGAERQTQPQRLAAAQPAVTG